MELGRIRLFLAMSLLVLIAVFLFLFPRSRESLDQKFLSSENKEQWRVELLKTLTSEDWFAQHKIEGDRKMQLKNLYSQNEFRPFWFGPKGFQSGISDFLQFCRSLPQHGMGQRQCRITAMAEKNPALFVRPFVSLQTPVIESDVVLELTLTMDFLDLRSFADRGFIRPELADPDWHIADDDDKSLGVQRGDAQRLADWVQQGDLVLGISDYFPRNPQYNKLKEALSDYQSMAESGVQPLFPETLNWHEGESDQHWIPILRERLRASHDFVFSPPNPGVDPGLFESALAEGLRHYQLRHGLKETGSLNRETLEALNIPMQERVNQIRANLERWRWLPRELPASYLQVNIADYQIDSVVDGRSALAIKVVVGREFRKTPSFSTQVTAIETNPQWVVPRKIAIEDLLPVLRKEPALLVKKGYHVFSEKTNQEVPLEKVKWQNVNSKNFAYRLVQQPGLLNALGRVKLWMPNPFGIYLHDSPSRELFERPVRTFSSGCIRLEEPMRLAEHLMESMTATTLERFRADVDSGVNRTFRLRNPKPIYILYWTVWVDDQDVIQFRPDIYDRNTKLIQKITSI